ncbi:MAG: IgGFc-binding protein [Labilithrix sp.]|nr:IgGFc-binding protein [Labilithrix sp.]
MERVGVLGIATSTFVLALTAVVACSGSKRSGFDEERPGTGSGDDNGGSFPGMDGGFGPPSANLPDEDTRDPVDCDEAAERKSYVGCDYWPTITPNPVWSIFDYTVVVANTGAHDAEVKVTGPNGATKVAKVGAGALKKIYLPWVRELKGADFNECTASIASDTSTIVPGGAYHLVSSTPVIVYQFNALQYKGEGGESPEGGPKDWSTCPGTTTGCRQGPTGPVVKSGCFSFSNDASLLLPSTAMTSTYRVMGHPGASVPGVSRIGLVPTALTVTATQPNTSVAVVLSSTASVVASRDGETIAKTEGGQTMTVSLPKAGDVLQLVSEKGDSFDFSGTLVKSSKPVQVITSVPCISIPTNKPACDHIEETVLPAETLGKHYVVAPPTGPKGGAVRHKVRLYGNKDGTTLTYRPSKPDACPDTLAAGETADCGFVDEAFEVLGNNEFGVGTFLLGATVYDPTHKDRRGDPSQSFVSGVEQFRTGYVLLAPNDYPVLYADVTSTVDAEIELDGAPVPAPWTMIGEGPFGVQRVDLTKSGADGAHTLTAKKPVGVQVIGFGDNTSFQYPAGLNLKIIAPPPSTK